MTGKHIASILEFNSDQFLNRTKIFDELTLEIICCLMALIHPLQKSENSRSTELPIYHPIWHFMATLGRFFAKRRIFSENMVLCMVFSYVFLFLHYCQQQ